MHAGLNNLESDERLIGWKGESFKPQGKDRNASTFVQIISWKPRSSIWHNFITVCLHGHNTYCSLV